MPAFEDYNQASSLQSTDAFVLFRPGVGSLYILGGPGGGLNPYFSALVSTSGETISAPGIYTFRSNLAALSATLAAISSFGGACPVIEFEDGDYNAGTNNFTVNASSGDSILARGVTSSSYVINISNTVTRMIGIPDLGWRVISYGQ